MAEVTLNANIRNEKTKSATKQLRRNGKVPGVFYSKSQQPLSIEVLETAINPLVFTSQVHIISLQVGDQDGLSCVLKDIQFDPVTDRIVHFDLLGVSKDEIIEVDVPVILVGNPEGAKAGGVLEQIVHKLIVKCLPKDMPQHLEINVEKLGLNESLHAKDLKFDNLEIANSPETVIAAVVTPRAQAEPGEGGEEAKEPEVITKGKTDKEEE